MRDRRAASEGRVAVIAVVANGERVATSSRATYTSTTSSPDPAEPVRRMVTRAARYYTQTRLRPIMNLFSTTPTQRQLGIGLLVLRIALASVFIVHGGQKLFMAGFGGTAKMLATMGIPASGLIGPLLALVEPTAGVCVLLGLFTRVAGLAIAIDMFAAIMLFHRHNGFFVPMGIEFVLMNCAAGFALAALGGGAFSIDHGLARRRT